MSVVKLGQVTKLSPLISLSQLSPLSGVCKLFVEEHRVPSIELLCDPAALVLKEGERQPDL